MSLLSHSPFLKALGWCLLNSVWQFGALWLLFNIILRLKRNCSPAIKHALGLVLLSTGFLWFSVSLCSRYFLYSDRGNAGTSFYNLSGNTAYTGFYRSIQSFLENNLSYLSLLYLLVVAGFFMRFFGYFRYARTLQNRGLIKMRAEWRLYVQQLVQQLAIRHKVQIWISEYIDTPMVMGFLKPTILIPLACINQLSVKQLEAILLHELAHIKRNDYLVNLCITTIEILFFFNPFARLFINSIKQEREKSCDDWVLQFRYEPYEYASALFTLEQNRSAAIYSLAIAAAGESKHILLQRIQRIMGIRKKAPGEGFKLLAYFVTIGLLGFIALVNPGEIVIKNIENKITAIRQETPELFAGSNRSIRNDVPTRDAGKNVKAKKINPRKTATSLVIAAKLEDDNLVDEIDAVDAEDDPQPAVTLVNALTTGRKDFSIKEEESPVLPEVAENNEFPFVPNSSFSYFSTEDSSLAKIKVEKYYNQAVRQSLLQAHRELQRMNLAETRNLQKIGKVSLPELQKKLQESVQQLNLQQLYLNLTMARNENTGLPKMDQEKEKLNYYKVLKLQFESIKTELQKQKEISAKDADRKLKEIQKEIRKIKVIVNI